MRTRHSTLAFGLALLMLAPAAFASEPIRIGLIAELTGANAEFGQDAIVGSNIAMEEINRAGGILGRPLTIVSEDNQSTNPGSEVAMSKLLRGDGVKAIITSPRSTQILAVMPAIARAGVPALVCGTLYKLTHAGNPWIFRVPPHDGYSSRALAEFGVETLKKRKWAIVHSEESFGNAAMRSLVEQLAAFGLAPAAVYGAGSTAHNFAPAVLAIRNSGADIVALYFARPEAAAKLAMQLRGAGVGSVLVGGSSMSSKAAMRIAGAALHGSYSAASYAAGASVPAKAFAMKYTGRTGDRPDQYASWAYDAVHLLAQAINNAGGTDPEAMRKGLMAIQGYQGAVGIYSFDRNGDGLHGYNILKNDGGKLAFVKNFSYPAK
ncbi:MAG: ABC transporter substrate-binding protein [Pseudomonadota bacterium]